MALHFTLQKFWLSTPSQLSHKTKLIFVYCVLSQSWDTEFTLRFFWIAENIMKKGSCISLTWTFKSWDEVHEEVTKTHHSTQLSMHEKNLLCNQDSSFNSLSAPFSFEFRASQFYKDKLCNSWFGFIFRRFSHFLIFFGRHLPHFSRKLSIFLIASLVRCFQWNRHLFCAEL